MHNLKIWIAIALSLSLTTVHAADNAIIQIGSFRNPQFAAEQSAKVALVGVRTQVVEVRQNGVTYYRVRTKPMPQNTAEQTLSKLQQNQIPAIIVSQ